MATLRHNLYWDPTDTMLRLILVRLKQSRGEEMGSLDSLTHRPPIGKLNRTISTRSALALVTRRKYAGVRPVEVIRLLATSRAPPPRSERL